MAHHVVVAIEPQGIRVLTFPRHGEPTEHGARQTDPADQAALIDAVIAKTDTSLVVLCGPAAAVRDLALRVRSMTPDDTTITTVDTDESADPSDGVVREVANLVAGRTVEMLQLWRLERAQGRAVDGVVETLDAFKEGHASLLVVHDDPSDERQAWFSPDEVSRIALDFSDAAPMREDEELRPARLVDVVIRASVLQRHPVYIVPDVPEERLAGGIGAFVSGAYEEGTR